MFYRKLYIIGLAFLGLGLQTTASAAQAPNSYNCTGKNTNLSLMIGSKAQVGIVAPKTTLDLQLGKTSHSYQESDITTESTLIGDIWEVTVKIAPDVYVDHASVIIPTISLGQPAVQTFKTKLVLTRVATPFTTNEFEGVRNQSRYVDLSCTASVLYY